MLTQTELQRLFHYSPDTGIFTRLVAISTTRAGDVAGYTHTISGYHRIKINNRKFLTHRLVWLYVYGFFPPNEIDHINGVRNDNRLTNLRLATRTENMRNISKNSKNKTGFKGVSFNEKTKKYSVKITVDGKEVYIGKILTLKGAVNAYRNLALKHYGEFAKF
jgi:hypothetical protein